MSAAAVVLPPLEGQQAQAWDTLMAVAEDLGEGWTLIGGQMVLLHQTERSPAGAQTVGGAGLRWSYDLDVVVNLRTSRSRMSHIDSVLTDHGFTQQVVPIRRPDPQGTPPHPPSCPDRRSGSRCARRGRSRSVWRCWRLRPHPIPADMGGMRGEARLDKVLALGVIPIVKTQELAGGKYRQGNIGPHPFTCRDGKIRELEIKTVNGSTCVKLPNTQGTAMAIPLERTHFRWGDETKDGNSTAYLKVRIPHDSGAPGCFKGATATVRLNSTPAEIHTSPHTRRTRSLRPIPESDPAFKLHGGREDIESTFADLKYRIRWKLCSHMEDRFRFNISCYQLLRLSRTLCEFHSRSP